MVGGMRHLKKSFMIKMIIMRWKTLLWKLPIYSDKWSLVSEFFFFLFHLPLSMIVFKDFSLIFWNVRGFASKKSKTHMRELLKRFKPDLLFIFETHTPFASSKQFCDKEGFKCLGVEEAQGHSGGAWVVVNQTSRFSYDVMDTMQQCISVKISFGVHSWVCTGAYASPNYTTRCLFWDYLVNLRTRIDQPWALIGDLNEILLPLDLIKIKIS